MKHFWNAKVKKLVSIVLAIALLVGLCPSILQTSAATTYSGRLHLKGAQTGSGANYMYLLGTDEVLCGNTPNEDWSVRLTPADDESGVYVNEERLTGGYELIKYYCDKNKVYNWYYLNGFDFTTAGSGKIEIKGNFANNKNNDIVNLKPVTFTYDNGTWTEEQEADETFTIANISGSAGDIYLRGTSGMPAKDWTTSLTPCGGSISFLDKETQEIKALTVDIRRPETGYYYFVLGEKNSGLSATTGDMVTIQGKFYLGDYCVDFAPTKMVRTEDTWSIVTEKDITFTGFAGDATGFSDGNWNIYLLPSSTLPGTNDSTHFTGLQMKVGEGEAFDITFNPTGYWNSAYFAVPADKMPENLADGTKITILAGKADSDDGSDGINLTSDFVFYAKDGGLTTEKPKMYQDITFTGVNGNTQYVEEYNGWFLYLTPSTTLPGVVDSTQFSGLTMQVGENEPFAFTFTKSSTAGTAWSLVGNANLPQVLSEDTKIVINAGKAESNDGSDGINLTEDFVMYVKENSFTTQIPPEYQVVEIGSVNVQGNAAGWDYMLGLANSIIDPDGSTWGPTYSIPVKINDVDYTATVNMADRSDAISFYLGVSGPELSDGMMMVIRGGNYKNTTGQYGINIVRDFAFEYDSSTGQWKEAIVQTDLQYDVNGNNTIDSTDLVRLLRYCNDNNVAINRLQADINGDGVTDRNDIGSLRKVLVGSISYSGTEGGNAPVGIPTYNNTKTVERMAYICPSAGTWTDGVFTENPNLDEELQQYKEAGFTLLNSETAATLLDNDLNETTQVELVTYLKAAQRNGLGVIVYSPYIVSALTQEDLANSSYSGWKTIIDLYLDFLNQYPAFKGFMMADELTIQFAENYQQIVSYLKEKNPNLILHSSQLPVMAYDVDSLGASSLTKDTTTNNTKEKAYKDYVTNFALSNGMFTYDLYALYSTTLGNTTYSVDDDWYTNLQYVADVAKENGFKTGITIQSCQLTGTSSWWKKSERYAPTQKADIGFQVYTAMAYGAQEINFYTYKDHPTDTTVENSIAVNADVKNAVKAVNTELASFGNVFKAFTWKDTLDIASGNSNTSTGNARLASVSAAGARALVGCMKDSDGFDGYMVANAEGPRTTSEATVTLTFNNATSAIVYKGTSCETVNLTGGVCTVTLAVGEGAFVLPIR